MASISTPAPASLITWKIDPVHTIAEFKVKHMMIANIRGTIKGITGDLKEHTTDASLSFIEATLDVSTLNTGERERDEHLKGLDFLALECFPTVKFKSTQVERKGEDEYAVTGDLTICGVTRPVTLCVEGPTPPQTDPWGHVRIGLEATAKINRRDFGLIWNIVLDSGGLLVGETVHITIDAEFVKD